MTPQSSNNSLMLPQPAALAEHPMARMGYPASGAFPAETSPVQRALASPPTFACLLNALRRRLPLALALAIVASFVVVMGVVMAMPALYTATVQFHIDSANETAIFGTGAGVEDFVIFKANQFALLKRPAVIANALNSKTSTGKEVHDLHIVREHADATDWLLSTLKADFLLGPEIMKVSLSADRPEEVAELLNAIANTFIEEADQRTKLERQRRMDQLADNKKLLEQELKDNRLRIRKREKESGIEDAEQRKQRYQAVLSGLTQAQMSVTQKHMERMAKEEELRNLERGIGLIDSMPVPESTLDDGLKDDFQAKGLFTSLETIEKNMSDIRQNASPSTVATLVSREQSKIQGIRDSIVRLRESRRPELETRYRNKERDLIRAQMNKLTSEITGLQRQEELLHAEAKMVGEQVQKEAFSVQSIPLDIVTLQEQITNSEKALEQVGQKLVLMRAEYQKPRVTLMQRATEPGAKDFSRQAKLAGVGGFGIFFAVLFGIAFMEFRTRKVNDPEEIQRGLGMALIGTVPAPPAKSLNPLAKPTGPDAGWQNQISESIDSIRTLLLHTSRSDSLRVIMVTSAVGGEGKTSLASQLAASLARSWRKTLLIDGDLRHPAAHKFFELPLEPGFSEVLRNEVNPADAIKPTAFSRLWLMPAGHGDAHAVQALGQDTVGTLFGQLKEQYDFIIVDSCPVLPVADAQQLGQYVDGAIFSVLRDVSRLPNIHAAQQKLLTLGIRTLGAVVMGSQPQTGTEAYKYAQQK